MKDNKKHVGLLGLLCLVICGALLLTACGDSGQTDPSTQPPAVADTTEATTQEVTEADTTEPVTEATTQETEPETTEEPTEESTEAPTERPVSSGGTGGGYTPSPSEPAVETTEPEEPATTESEIQVPAAGSEANAYYENISAVADSFSTVKIPAESAMYYIVKTSGAYLRIESADAAVVYDGQTVVPKDGVLQLQLSGGSEASSTALQFVNNGKQEQAFTVYILAELGAQSNPIILSELSQLDTKLEKDDTDGLYYSWTADKSGILSLGLSSVTPATAGADIIVTVNEKTVKLSDSSNGLLQIPVNAGDPVIVQVIATADQNGSYPALEAVVNGGIAPVAELKAEQIPETLSTDEIASGETVYYNIYGVNGTLLMIRDADAAVSYNGTVYGADEDGNVTVPVAPGPKDQAVQLQIMNGGQLAKAFVLEFGYPAGHLSNPETLTQLGKLESVVQAGTDGYFYQYTAEAAGVVTFHIAVQPDALAVRTDIILRNEQTQQEAALWTQNADGNLTQLEEVSVDVAAGDSISVCVRVVDMVTDSCVDAKLTVEGKLDSFRLVEYPGFTAVVAAGETAYYEGYNLDDTIFCLTGENVAVTHGGVTYIPKDGQILFRVTAESRMPARFEIENRGSEDGEYEVTLSYLVGHRMNPDVLALGSSFVNQSAGADEYCFNYVAPKSGQLIVNFDQEGQWCYTLDNLTQQIFGETVFSDSEAANVAMITVAEGDELQLRVNTYDPDAPWEAPEGSVEFTVTLSTGPVAINDVSKPYVSTILAGETVNFTGALQGTVITIENAQNATLCYNGEYYEANAEGVLTLNFLEPNGGDNAFSFTLLNRAAEDWECTMNISTISGGPLDPAQMQLGASSVTNAEGAAGYWFSYTAPKAGNLILTFSEDGKWTYAINGGANQTMETAGTEKTIAVQSGDQVLIWVNTYDAAKPEAAPAGTVSFEATLITGPVEITDLSQPYVSTILAGETVNFTGALQGTVITIENAQNATLCYNGEYYEANEEGVLTLNFLEPNGGENAFSFTLLNRAAEDWECTMNISAISGGPLDPAQMQLGASSVTNAEGAAGYWFSYTAPKAGNLILTFSEDGKWTYAINGGANQTMETAGTEKTVAVQSGDQVLIWVNTYDAAKPEAAPAGTVSFEATLITGPVEITDLSQPYVSTILAGETVNFTGALQGTVITIENAQNATLCYNGEYYEANEEGVLTLNFLEPNGGENAFSFTLLNRAAEDWECTMNISAISGGPLAADELKLGVNAVNNPEGGAGYWFCYTAPKVGSLVLNFPEDASWSYAINDGENQHSDTAEAEVTVAVESGEQVLVWVNTYDPENRDTAPAGTVSFETTLVSGPVEITDITVPFETTLLAGETVKYSGQLHGAVVSIANAQQATLYYNGEPYEANAEGTLSIAFLEPNTTGEVEIILHNRATEDWDCTMTVTAIPGGPLDPKALQLGTGSVSNAEAGAAGAWFCYDASKSGTLTLTFDAEADWCYAVNGGQIVTGNTENADNVAQIPVQTGEKVMIWINTYDPENPETAPAGEVSFAAALLSSPVELDLTKAYEASLLTGETALFTGQLRNAVITIANANYFTVIYNGQEYEANEVGTIVLTCLEPDSDGNWQFTVRNNSVSDQSCPMRFSGIVGSWLNPAELAMGENTVQQAEGAAEYCYSYTAPKAGSLILRFDVNARWSYRINDGETVYSDSEPAADIAEVTVAAGDTVDLCVNTYDPETPDTVPAGSVTFHASLTTEPVTIGDLLQPFEAELLVGETAQYTGYFKDAVITVSNAEDVIAYYGDAVYTANEDGNITFSFDTELWEFSLANNADADVSCTMSFAGDVGTWLNPAAMTLGANTVTQTEGADDYYLSYQVPKTGELMLTFDENAAWSYIIGDGEKQYSTTPGSNVAKITVENGDTVLLQVNTYDPDAPDVVPAGEVSFAATLITGPVAVTDYEQPLLVTMLAGETVRVSGAPGGEKLTIDSAENLTVTCGENVYTANEEGVITFKLPEAADGEALELTVHNSAQQDGSCIIIFGAEKGTADNPATLVVGENTATCKAGSDGYYFTFTATKDCQIRLTFDKESTWAFVWDYGEGNSDKASSSWKFRSGKILAGQTITVLIKTYDPANPDVVPEGTVRFEMDIPTYY